MEPALIDLPRPQEALRGCSCQSRDLLLDSKHRQREQFIRVQRGQRATWKTITIPEGSYELLAINGEIQRQMKASGDWNSASNEYYITLGGNTSTLRAFLEITSPTCRVDMAQSTIRSLLGFAPETVSPGYTEASNPVNILSVNSIRVECDLIDNSYVNGEREPVVYLFFPNAQPGEKIIERCRGSCVLTDQQERQHRAGTHRAEGSDRQAIEP
jgi:hypothetical protein